jgi:phosphate transport system substrate-binding protein
VVSWNRSARARKRGVAERIKINEGAIGYVEFWFAQRLELRTAVLQNKAGKFIIPTASSGELALSGRVAQVKQFGASVADPATSGAYPIPSYADASKAAASPL